MNRLSARRALFFSLANLAVSYDHEAMILPPAVLHDLDRFPDQRRERCRSRQLHGGRNIFVPCHGLGKESIATNGEIPMPFLHFNRPVAGDGHANRRTREKQSCLGLSHTLLIAQHCTAKRFSTVGQIQSVERAFCPPTLGV